MTKKKNRNRENGRSICRFRITAARPSTVILRKWTRRVNTKADRAVQNAQWPRPFSHEKLTVLFSRTEFSAKRGFRFNKKKQRIVRRACRYCVPTSRNRRNPSKKKNKKRKQIKYNIIIGKHHEEFEENERGRRTRDFLANLEKNNRVCQQALYIISMLLFQFYAESYFIFCAVCDIHVGTLSAGRYNIYESCHNNNTSACRRAGGKRQRRWRHSSSL